MPGYVDYGVGDLAFSPDGKSLYFTDFHNVVRWDFDSHRVRILASENIHGVGVNGLYFVRVTPDGQRLLVAGWPGVAAIDANTGRVVAADPRIPAVFWMTLSADGRQIAITDSPAWPSSGVGGSIELLRAPTLRLVRTIGPRLDGDAYTALAFSPDGGRLAYGTNEGSAGVFDLRTGSLVVSFPGHTTNIYEMEFSPDGRRVVTAAGDGRAFVWRAAGDQLRSIETNGLSTAGDGWVNSDLAFTRSGLVTRFEPIRGPNTGTEVIQRVDQRRRLSELPLGPRSGGYVRLSGDGRYALVASPPATGIIQRPTIWDTITDRPVRRFTMTAVCCPVISSDGRDVAFQTPNSALEVERLATGQMLHLGKSRCGGWVFYDFSAEARRIAASSVCGEVKVWNALTGRVVGHPLNFVGFMNLGPVRFSPNGRVLAVANSGNVGQVSIVSLATDRTIAVLHGDTKGIQDLAFSPNGALLATASLDSTARLWNARNGQLLRIDDDPSALDNVAFSPSGAQLATMDYAGIMNIWDACTDCTNPSGLLSIASRRVTRQLTPAEQQTYLH